mmetsp:Transcript_1808/g.4123  ORF Transcript_1808/g.4123 Transcript_1808/m.4123 type:complete len:265 (+) Transcript_1808:337-1131(+)
MALGRHGRRGNHELLHLPPPSQKSEGGTKPDWLGGVRRRGRGQPVRVDLHALRPLRRRRGLRLALCQHQPDAPPPARQVHDRQDVRARHAGRPRPQLPARAHAPRAHGPRRGAPLVRLPRGLHLRGGAGRHGMLLAGGARGLRLAFAGGRLVFAGLHLERREEGRVPGHDLLHGDEPSVVGRCFADSREPSALHHALDQLSGQRCRVLASLQHHSLALAGRKHHVAHRQVARPRTGHLLASGSDTLLAFAPVLPQGHVGLCREP